MDRGYAKFALFNKIVKAKSSYVCRLRDNSANEVVESRELTDAATTAAPQCPAAGILSDQIVIIGQNGKADALPDHRAPTARLVAFGVREVFAAHQSGQIQRRIERSRQRRRVTNRHQSAGHRSEAVVATCRDHRADLF
jgi:hypothetical protein